MWGYKTSFSQSHSTASRSMVNDTVSCCFGLFPPIPIYLCQWLFWWCAVARPKPPIYSCWSGVGSWLALPNPLAHPPVCRGLAELRQLSTALRISAPCPREAIGGLLRQFAAQTFQLCQGTRTAHCLRQWCTTGHGPCIVDYGGCLPQNGRDQVLQGLHHGTKNWSCAQLFHRSTTGRGLCFFQWLA